MIAWARSKRFGGMTYMDHNLRIVQTTPKCSSLSKEVVGTLPSSLKGL